MHIKIFYPTHMSEGQWSYINKVFFENDCRKRKYFLRSIFEAILFILVGGCQWRIMLHKWERLDKLLVDQGYRGYVAADIKKDFLIEKEISNTHNGIKGFVPKPLR